MGRGDRRREMMEKGERKGGSIDRWQGKGGVELGKWEETRRQQEEKKREKREARGISHGKRQWVRE